MKFHSEQHKRRVRRQRDGERTYGAMLGLLAFLALYILVSTIQYQGCVSVGVGCM